MNIEIRFDIWNTSDGITSLIFEALKIYGILFLSVALFVFLLVCTVKLINRAALTGKVKRICKTREIQYKMMNSAFKSLFFESDTMDIMIFKLEDKVFCVKFFGKKSKKKNIHFFGDEGYIFIKNRTSVSKLIAADETIRKNNLGSAKSKKFPKNIGKKRRFRFNVPDINAEKILVLPGIPKKVSCVKNNKVEIYSANGEEIFGKKVFHFNAFLKYLADPS